MIDVSLTGADLADLAAGLRFNTVDANGDERVIDGCEFDVGMVAALAAGGEVVYDDGDALYLVNAPEPAWAGHRTPAEMDELQKSHGRNLPR